MQLEDERYFPRGVYTFGQPRTGDVEFARAFDSRLQAVTYRFVNNNDVVTHLPPDQMFNNSVVLARIPAALRGFKHVGQFRYFDSQGKFYESLSTWERVKLGIAGLFDDAGDFKLDGIKDHALDNYAANLKRYLPVPATDQPA